MWDVLDVAFTLALLVIVILAVNRIVVWSLCRLTIRPTLRLMDTSVAVLDDVGRIAHEEPNTVAFEKKDDAWRIVGMGEAADRPAAATDRRQVLNVVTEHTRLPRELGGLLDGLLLYCARRSVLTSPIRPRFAVARPIRGKVKLDVTAPEDRAWALREIGRSKYFEVA